ncbi:hypothetical protein KKG51_01835 [Patescibacteria group bacterium]|nr:hypothetical protein [Patescibacteria group bacterium]
MKNYKKLQESEPQLSVHVWKSVNSDYCDQLDMCKNCYIVFNSRLSEDCMYSYDSRWDKDCCDISYSNHCELCYEALDCEKCYSCDFCQDCENCQDCWYCYDCKSCKDCFGCVGLRHKRYHIFNKEYSKENYLEKVAKLTDKNEIYKKMEELNLKYPHVALYSMNAENSFGNYIVNSKNSYYVFKVHQLEDCYYMYDSQENKDCVDCCSFNCSELCYGCMENSTLYNCNFMYWCANCVDCEYLSHCFDCTNCFGCVNLKHKHFYILNKPYEKEDYFKKIAEIKEKMKKQGIYGY